MELRRPDLRVNLYLYRDEAQIAVDLTGEGLHRRGYRREGGEAPLTRTVGLTFCVCPCRVREVDPHTLFLPFDMTSQKLRKEHEDALGHLPLRL